VVDVPNIKKEGKDESDESAEHAAKESIQSIIKDGNDTKREKFKSILKMV